MQQSLENLYNLAKEHKDHHKSCGGEPYKSFHELFMVVDNLNKSNNKDLDILEIGTAVGFTTFILQNKNENSSNFVDTIEFHQDHIDLAKENISKWSGYTENEVGGDINKINFYVGDATDILPTLNKTYDLIFFDGYGAKLKFYNDFHRLLKVGGLLISANQHLKSTEKEYFELLDNRDKWEIVSEFADTKIHQKLVN